MNRIFLPILLATTFLSFSLAQPDYTSPDDILRAFEDRERKRNQSIYNNYPVRNVGPVVQGGRVTDIAVNPLKPKEFYIAFASGGVFKTGNNGITFQPVFDHVGALTTGDICIAPSDPDIIWVGTGENNSSRSSYAGSGLYKSLDGGKNWSYAGLAAIQHTGRIVIHPENPEVVWVAGMGNLYSHNPERGIFKTIDGGENWHKTLYVNDSSGAIDLIIHPEDPAILWASTWERTRKAWNFKGHGPGSAIFKSVDGGESWKVVMEGIKDPELTGRIGLTVCLDQPDILYALVDSQVETKTEKERDGEDLIPADFMEMNKETFLDLDNEKLGDYLEQYHFPSKYSAEKVKAEVKANKYPPRALAEYVGDANTALFDTDVRGAEVYRSADGGETWNKTHDFRLKGLYYTYGYYFGEIRVAPDDPDRIYVSGVPLLISNDGGKTFARIDTIGDVHVDHHAMWIDPEDPEHIILGNDGGLYISYDGGAAWDHVNNVPAGQFYTVNVDMDQPYNIYGGLQDNGVLFGPSTSVPNVTAHWDYLFGGDGMFVIPDPRNSDLVYLGYQFGNYYKINKSSGERKFITPKNDIGEERLRFNWRTPLLMSNHIPDILYMGAQKVFRTLDKADSWEVISEDLTRDLPSGNVPFSTITVIEESALKFGLIYAGTDDGKVHVTKNGGYSWEDISPGLPEGKWISSIHPSNFDESLVYLSLTGYRQDDFRTYVYRSDGYGTDWEPVNGNLTHEAVNIILEDPQRKGLLYLGTDHSTYISMDDGASWDLMAPVPNVASYDMVVHPRDHDLVIGTHGRSIYVLPVQPIRELAEKNRENTFLVCNPDPEKIRHSEDWGEKQYPFMPPFMPETRLLYYIPEGGQQIKFEVFKDELKLLERSFSSSAHGFNYYHWDLKINKLEVNDKRINDEFEFAGPGEYELHFTWRDQSEKVMLTITSDE